MTRPRIFKDIEFELFFFDSDSITEKRRIFTEYICPAFEGSYAFFEDAIISFYGYGEFPVPRENTHFSYYKYIPAVIKYTWDTRGFNYVDDNIHESLCELVYNDTIYQLSLYRSFPILMRAILSSVPVRKKKMSYGKCRSSYFLLLLFDLNNVVIPDDYAFYVPFSRDQHILISSFDDLSDDYKTPIMQRYEEQKKMKVKKRDD